MNGSALVDRYLAELASAAATLPIARRAELLDEVREHIASALESAAPEDEVAVRNVLERLGTPAEIIAAEWAAEGGPPRPTTRPAPPPPPPPVVSPPALGPPPPPPAAAPNSSWGTVASIGLGMGAFAIGAIAVLGVGPYSGIESLFWVSPVLVLLATYLVYRGRRRAEAPSGTVSPETAGFLAFVVVLTGIAWFGGPYLLAMTCAMFLPVLVLLPLISAARGRRTAPSAAPVPRSPRSTPALLSLAGIIAIIGVLLAIGHATAALIIAVTFLPVMLVTLGLSTASGPRSQGVTLAIGCVLGFVALVVVSLFLLLGVGSRVLSG
jgi:hypothetical protein